MKPIINLILAVIISFLFVFVVIFWGAYKETQFQYNTFQVQYSKNMECRAAITKNGTVNALGSFEKTCGPIPTWEDFK